MSCAVVRSLLGSLFAVTTLLVHSPVAHAGPVGVTANDANYTYPLPTVPGDVVTITLNVLENVDTNGAALVSGGPRPLQLVSASSTDAVMVSNFRNCITVSFVSPGPTLFSVNYSVADGRNPGLPSTETGTITFFGSSTQSYVSPEDTSCGDAQILPAANDDTAATTTGQSTTIPVLDNDGAPGHVIFAPGAGDNDVFQVTTTAGGTALALPDNTIQYTPLAGFTGVDTFTYILESYSQPGFEALNPTATVTVSVLPNQNPPPTGMPNAQLTVNGGTATSIPDTDQKPGETVQFGVVETVVGALVDIVSYAWFVGEETTPRQSSPSPMLSVALPDGSSLIKVIAQDSRSMSFTLWTSVTITATPKGPSQTLMNAQLLVNGGPMTGGTVTTIPDSDLKPGENVTFSVQETVAGELADIVTYDWYVNAEATPRQSGTSSAFNVTLFDGANGVRVVATDTNSMMGELWAQVTIGKAADVTNVQLLVNGGMVTNIADSDQKPGESVQFALNELVAGELDDVVNFDWFVGQESAPRQNGPSRTFTVALPDGPSLVRVVGTDAQSTSGSLSTMVTIAAPGTTQPTPQPVPPPDPLVDAQILVNGAKATTLADTDLKAGETVLFAVAINTSASVAAIVNFDWFVNKEDAPRQSGTSAKFQTALPDGSNVVTVVAKDAQGNTGGHSITVTIGAAPPMLMQLTGLQPNQMGVAGALDRMCRDDMPTDMSGLTDDQRDALARCQAIARSDPADQMRALEELSGMDFNGSRTQTLLFTKSTYSGVSDRMGALRGGARGVSLRGFNLIIDGKAIPLAELQNMVGKLLGGGASADDDPGSLLGDKWGVWTRGNMTLGRKSASDADRGFKANQFSLVSGLDYRITEDSVIGSAVSFGASNVAYNPIGEGGLDTKSWAVTLYGTTYALKRGYVDVSLNVADSSYASHRRINYTDNLGSIDRNARGKTDGLTWSTGLSGGYDLVFKGLSLSPNGSVFYTDSGIDGFRERGAGGLDLAYEDQNFESLTATLGLRINYTLRLPFGVVLPYLRADYVRELQAKVAIFNVRFANDTDSSADPIAVQSDTPDKSYWKLSSGMSAQLPFGFAGYVEYQRLQSFQFVDFQDFAFGLRIQTRF